VSVSFDQATATLVLDRELLIDLARVQDGQLSPADAPEALVAAGLVTSTGVDEVAGDIARTAVAPLRATVVERFDGTTMAPLFVGWSAGGSATVTGADAEGRAQVTGTHLAELPALISRWTGLDQAQDATDRSPVSTTTGALDALITDPSAVDDVALRMIAEAWIGSWRASGSWGDGAVDAQLTIVDTGASGLWRVAHPPRLASETLPAELVPMTVASTLAALGDVVTGRRSPRPSVADQGRSA
jgi:hypothetical protein